MTFLAACCAAVWLYLLAGRGAFWLSRVDEVAAPADAPPALPKVVAIVPARNEAALIALSLGSLLNQAYAGSFSIILVDDGSEDETAARARATAAERGADDRLMILAASALPPGWTGKLWALSQGIARAEAMQEPPDYLLLSDADIAYAPDALAGLVARAQAGSFVLTSLMAKLRCQSRAERGLIPAFIFFFEMLYPFAWVNDRNKRTAAAAGGCMLVDRNALTAVGGIAAIGGALIDDCALARTLKQQGPISLSLTRKAESLRACDSIAEIHRMVARSAYAQLNYSPLALAATVLGMGLTFLAPPLLALIVPPPAASLGLAAWMLMALAFLPTVRFYRVPLLSCLALPLIAGAYLVFTLDSALQFHRGRGGMWKGRPQAFRSETR